MGQCSTATAVTPENWLRGQFDLTCTKGTVRVVFTLAPTQPPGVQFLSFQKSVPASTPGATSCSDE